MTGSLPPSLTCSEAGRVQGLRQLLQFLLPLQENKVSLILLHQVHLVNETENFGLKTFRGRGGGGGGGGGY